jgi:hypothetical protein
MCIVCGVPDPAHDVLWLRLVVLTTGTGLILAPRAWLGRVIATWRRGRQRVK